MRFLESQFLNAHDEFLTFVQASDTQGLSFESVERPFETHPFFQDTEMVYKRKARRDALALLPSPGNWHNWLDEPGRLLRALYDATFKAENLLVRNYGDADNSASPVYLALDQTTVEQSGLERQLAHLFDGPTAPETFGPRFDALADYVRDHRLGCKWDFFAYLAFLADDARYFPVKSSHFTRLLRFYGSDAPFEGHVSWDRYRHVLDLADWVRDQLPDRYGEPDALQVQSYLWIVAYAVVPRLEGTLAVRALKAKDFRAEERLRQARAAERERIGLRGEQLCYTQERDRLEAEGRSDLAKRVELVSRRDASAGYDLLTFDDEGHELHVEVKTTTWPRASVRGFWLSQNELRVAEGDSAWRLWRVWDVDGSAEVEPLGNVVQSVPDGWRREAASWRYWSEGSSAPE